MQDNPIGFMLVVLKPVTQSGIDLSWEGQAELELSVGPLIRGRFLNLDIGILSRIEHWTDVTLHIEGLRYEVSSVDRSGAFEAVAYWG